MKIKTIILEEYINIILENYGHIDYDNMNIQNLIDIVVEMSRTSEGDMLDRDIISRMLTNAAKQGEENLINTFKDMTKLDIFLTRTGRYSFTPQVTPIDYEEKLE